MSWESLKTLGPPQIGSCVWGGDTIGGLDFSPTFIIKPYHQKGGTEVPPYDIDKLPFVGSFAREPNAHFINRPSQKNPRAAACGTGIFLNLV